MIDIDTLPRREATEVKNKWGAVTRQVKSVGRVAITNRKEIELVVMSADAYRQLMAKIGETDMRQQKTLAQLAARFDENLAKLQTPDASKRLDSFFDPDGHAATTPIVGATF